MMLMVAPPAWTSILLTGAQGDAVGGAVDDFHVQDGLRIGAGSAEGQRRAEGCQISEGQRAGCSIDHGQEALARRAAVAAGQGEAAARGAADGVGAVHL